MFTIDIEQLKRQIVENSKAVQEAINVYLNSDVQDESTKARRVGVAIANGGFGCRTEAVRKLMSEVLGTEVPKVAVNSNNSFVFPRKMYVIKLRDNLTKEHSYPFFPQQPILMTTQHAYGMYIQRDQEADGSFTSSVVTGGKIPLTDKGLKSIVFCDEEEINEFIDELVETSKDFTRDFINYSMHEADWKLDEVSTEEDEIEEEDYD